MHIETVYEKYRRIYSPLLARNKNEIRDMSDELMVYIALATL